MTSDEFRERVREIKRKKDQQQATVWYSNGFEEQGKIKGPVEFREVLGYEMVVITRGNGDETLLHFSDVERIDLETGDASSD